MCAFFVQKILIGQEEVSTLARLRDKPDAEGITDSSDSTLTATARAQSYAKISSAAKAPSYAKATSPDIAPAGRGAPSRNLQEDDGSGSTPIVTVVKPFQADDVSDSTRMEPFLRFAAEAEAPSAAHTLPQQAVLPHPGCFRMTTGLAAHPLFPTRRLCSRVTALAAHPSCPTLQQKDLWLPQPQQALQPHPVLKQR